MLSTALLMATFSIITPPVGQSVAVEIDAIVHGKRPCTDLQVHYEESDGVGGTLSVRVYKGRVTVHEDSLGLPPRVTTSWLDPKRCYDISVATVKEQLWKERHQKVTGRPIEHARVRIGVVGAESFAIAVTERQLLHAPAFRRMRAHLIALADVVRTAGRSHSTTQPTEKTPLGGGS